MMRKLLLLAILPAVAFSVFDTLNDEELAIRFRGHSSEEVSNHRDSLSPRELAAQKKLFQDGDHLLSEEEYLQEMKFRSHSLYRKTVALQNTLNRKFNSLGYEAKEFVTKLWDKVHDLYIQHVLGELTYETFDKETRLYVKALNGVSTSAKQEIIAQFPVFFHSLQGRIFACQRNPNC